MAEKPRAPRRRDERDDGGSGNGKNDGNGKKRTDKKEGDKNMKRAFWMILTAVLVLALGLAVAETYEGTIVAGQIQPVAAAYG